MGSSVARVAGTGEGPLLVVLGHIDEIGVMVTHVDDKGFVFFLTVGGPATRTFSTASASRWPRAAARFRV